MSCRSVSPGKLWKLLPLNFYKVSASIPEETSLTTPCNYLNNVNQLYLTLKIDSRIFLRKKFMGMKEELHILLLVEIRITFEFY